MQQALERSARCAHNPYTQHCVDIIVHSLRRGSACRQATPLTQASELTMSAIKRLHDHRWRSVDGYNTAAEWQCEIQTDGRASEQHEWVRCFMIDVNGVWMIARMRWECDMVSTADG
jgi:hypothetical protein